MIRAFWVFVLFVVQPAVADTVPFIYPRSQLEITNSVQPRNVKFYWGDIRRYGSSCNGGNDTAALALALQSGHHVLLPEGICRVTGGSLTITKSGQHVTGRGGNATEVRKTTAGAVFTISATHVELEDMSVTGNGVLGGDNIVLSDFADNVALRDLNVYNTTAMAVNAGEVDQLTIRGGLYDNTNAAAGTPVVTIGKATGMTDMAYYFVVDGITLQPSGNPIRVYSSGSGSLANSQLGGVQFYVGAFGQSVSNRVTGNRITGPIYDEGANSNYAGNAVGAHPVEFAAGSSGIFWSSNTRASGSTFVNNGLSSNILIEPDYTGASGYVNFNNSAGLRISNNKYFRFYDVAGTNYGYVGMSTGNNLTIANNSGSLDIAGTNWAAGSFTATVTGMASATTGTINYRIQGKMVTLWTQAAITGTSNTTAMTVTGLPALVTPTVDQARPCHAYNNSASLLALCSISSGIITVSPYAVSGTLLAPGNNFTASGIKGLPLSWSISYVLN